MMCRNVKGGDAACSSEYRTDVPAVCSVVVRRRFLLKIPRSASRSQINPGKVPTGQRTTTTHQRFARYCDALAKHLMYHDDPTYPGRQGRLVFRNGNYRVY
jgi:hypothetical protein